MKPKRVLLSALALAALGWLGLVSISFLRTLVALSDFNVPVAASGVTDTKPSLATAADTASSFDSSTEAEANDGAHDFETSRIPQSVLSYPDTRPATLSDLAGHGPDACRQHWEGMNELRCLRLSERANGILPPESDQDDTQVRMVLIDAAHGNDVSNPSSGDTLRQFLQHWGYATRELEGAIESGSLDEVDVFMSYLPLKLGGPQSAFESSTVLPAFTPDEAANVKSWVERGGSLFLVIDHAPFAGAAWPLTALFGIETSNGYVVDKQAVPYVTSRAVAISAITFSRENGSLAEHVVTRGINGTERVELIGAYSGAAFRLPRRAVSVLTLGDNVVSLMPERPSDELAEHTPTESVAGWSMGGLLRVGEGRVAIFGEDGIPLKVALWTPPALVVDNIQLTKNVFGWLTED